MYKQTSLADDAERDLRLVRDMAAEIHYGALPRAWQHVYNLLMEVDRAYVRGKYDARLEAEKRAEIAALPRTLDEEATPGA